MSVSNSKLLGRVEIDFDQQYNAVIGGRGTGKSTMLEYLRSVLCDQPVDNTDSDIAPVQTKRKKLIDDTLQKVDGEVIVTFLLNNVRHIIKRNSKTQENLLKDWRQRLHQDHRVRNQESASGAGVQPKAAE